MMLKSKILAGAVAAATLIGGLLYAAHVLAERSEYLARAEAAEAEVERLAKANARLEAAGAVSVAAAALQSTYSVEALARRDELDRIMAEPCPVPTVAENATVPTKGEPINETQSRRLVDFYNDVFSDVGLRPGRAAD